MRRYIPPTSNAYFNMYISVRGRGRGGGGGGSGVWAAVMLQIEIKRKLCGAAWRTRRKKKKKLRSKRCRSLNFFRPSFSSFNSWVSESWIWAVCLTFESNKWTTRSGSLFRALILHSEATWISIGYVSDVPHSSFSRTHFLGETFPVSKTASIIVISVVRSENSQTN